MQLNSLIIQVEVWVRAGVCVQRGSGPEPCATDGHRGRLVLASYACTFKTLTHSTASSPNSDYRLTLRRRSCSGYVVFHKPFSSEVKREMPHGGASESPCIDTKRLRKSCHTASCDGPLHCLQHSMPIHGQSRMLLAVEVNQLSSVEMIC